jgi:hypothetical protein
MLRFTICDLLWLMVVVGLAITLAFEHRKATLAEMAWHYWEDKAQPKPNVELNKTTHISCTIAPLSHMADYLSQMHATPIVLAPEVDGEIQITCNVTNQPLRVGLEKMLSPHNLDYRIDNGAIVIQQRQEANSPPAVAR